MSEFIVILILILWLSAEGVRSASAQRAKEATAIWSRVHWQLSARLPSAFGSSGPSPDIDDAFELLYAAKKLMGVA